MAKKKPAGVTAYEKLGAFYLGRAFDPEQGATTQDLVLYDAKDLTTHAVCVGMTGSGKTGLCIGLLEEAAIDGIPAIAIDPKGDLGNLALTFPKLRKQDFLPWIDPGEAARKGVDIGEHAEATAKMWREGLADWGQGADRIARLRDAADVAIYTPGSSAGLPLAALKSLASPPPEMLDDAEALRERIAASVSGLLALVGIDADPVQSREHIFLSTLLEHLWRDGQDVEIADLVRLVQSPPFDRLGVLDLDTVFPAQDRMGLSMRLNNLLASPGFAGWMEGEPLDVQRLLWTADGKPRIAILSIAHLSDPERMFFVTLLMNEVVAWMRTQSGTTSLRALVYLDEVFGYLPPTANPPSKQPLLTLLKQARAFGLGVVLATQNPVDLDYKALSNAGTWFLGRLQTERDKLRVLDGLEGAAASGGAQFDRREMETTLSGLTSRVFVMNNVHDDAPVLFHTRWVLSYLRGPLTRDQIEQLTPARAATVAASPVTSKPRAKSAVKPKKKTSVQRPVVPEGVLESFISPTSGGGEGSQARYAPALLATADLHFSNARAGVDSWETFTYFVPLGGARGNVWSRAELLPEGEPGLDDEPFEGAGFEALPASAKRASGFRSWKTKFKAHLYRHHTKILFRCRPLKLTSDVDETEGDFRVRVREAAREHRDLTAEKLRKRYAPKLARLQEKITAAERRVAKEETQYGQQKMQTAISVGATVLGALFGRKVASVGTVGRASTAMRGAGRAAREKQDIDLARDRLLELQSQLEELEAEFQTEVDALDDAEVEITEQPISPRKSDTTISRFELTWVPSWIDGDGRMHPFWPRGPG